MLRCDKRVYEQCPDKEYCGSLDNAIFVEGSECDKYNCEVLWDIERKTAADVVEVVRCKDCKYWNKEASACDTLPRVNSFEHENWYADDFCS